MRNRWVRDVAVGFAFALGCNAQPGGEDMFGPGDASDGSDGGGDSGGPDAGSTGGSEDDGSGSVPSGGGGTTTTTEAPTSGGASGSTTTRTTTDTGDPTTGGVATTTDEPTGCNPICLDVGVGGTTGSGPVCGQSNYIVEPDRSDVLLLLDASGSMVNPPLYWDHDNDGATPTISRWHSLHNVVETIVNAFEDTINLGLQFFPQPGDPKDCQLASQPEVPVGPAAGMDILAALPPKDAFDELWQNPTPTRDGMEAAVAHVDPSPRDRAIVLVSDGAVSEPCFNTHDETLAVITDAYQSKGIPTYVVGINIQSSWEAGYNAWAQAGGRPLPGGTSYYDVRNEIELLSALQSISGLNISCIAPLNPEPPDPQMVQVRLDGSIVPPATDCSTEDGWVYTKPAGPYDEIELCGSFCSTFKSGGGEVLALYNCPPEG